MVELKRQWQRRGGRCRPSFLTPCCSPPWGCWLLVRPPPQTLAVCPAMLGVPQHGNYWTPPKFCLPLVSGFIGSRRWWNSLKQKLGHRICSRPIPACMGISRCWQIQSLSWSGWWLSWTGCWCCGDCSSLPCQVLGAPGQSCSNSPLGKWSPAIMCDLWSRYTSSSGPRNRYPRLPL